MKKRPIYESSSDLIKEKRVVEVISDALELEYHKLPRSYGLDFALFEPEDQSLRCFVEVKCRENHSQRYDTLLLSLLKIISGHKLTTATNKPCYLVAAFTDGLFFNKLLVPNLGIELSGRTDRNDPADLEPCVHYPLKKMRKAAAFNVFEEGTTDES